MGSPYDIYGKVVEFKCGFGRIFVHVNVAPRHKDREKLDAIERAVRDISVSPEDKSVEILPFGYTLNVYDPKKKKRTPCNCIRVRFRRLQTMPESVMDNIFPYQKGAVMSGDVFIDTLSFLAVGTKAQ